MKMRVMTLPSLTVYLAAVTFTSLGVSGHIIDTSSNSPVVRGATVELKAEVFTNDGVPASGEFQYIWKDVARPERNVTVETSSPVSRWNLTCDSNCSPGKYRVQITILEKEYIFFFRKFRTIANESIDYEVTKALNGELVLRQGAYNRTGFVDSSATLNQTIELKKSDLDYVESAKKVVRSFWFVDCVYYGQEIGYEYELNFTKADSRHLIESLVVATEADSRVVDATGNETRDANETISGVATDEFWSNGRDFKEWLENFNKTHPRANNTFNASSSSYKCLDISSIPLNDNYTYGLFRTNFTVKDPVKVSPINGTNWLKDGEILNITVSCTGSPPYKYCYFMRLGLYNVTGNEVCRQEQSIRNCSFNIQHFFKESPEYTVVVFISNAVSRVVKPIGVIIYKSTRHAQLSVIIVPVGFSMVAVILIIFGVAHYVQKRRSYTVEVADFDFANQSTDMEYKTFRERLRESVSHLFRKSSDFDDDEDEDGGRGGGREGHVWSPSRKYGSMQ